MSPAVTVAIPFTKFDQYLDRAIRSVFAQSLDDWALLLFGDGASDEDVLRATQIADARVSVHRSKSRRGLAATLNQVAHLAETEYLVRMDADDIMRPMRLHNQMTRLTAQDPPDLVCSHSYAIDQESQVLGLLKERPIPSDPKGFLESNCIAHPTVSGKTEWFLRNPYNTDYARAQDKELWLRTAGQTAIEKLDSVDIYYRIDTTISGTKRRVSGLYNRQLLRDYGPVYSTRSDTALRILRVYGGELMSKLPLITREKGASADRRVVPLSDSEEGTLQSELKSIVSIPVPGL
ncbi:glycosyltransferase family A protein [Rhodococcus sp. BUPNP1]|uniref:glycosyltransferase family 2 protein n=1 Tax=Rhodococcus sp. BUPNP1 TaxID=1432786 RepID=UPI001C0ECECD